MIDAPEDAKVRRTPGSCSAAQALRRSPWRSASLWLIVGVTLLALALRVITALADFRTTDESTWRFLSWNFSEAVTSGDFHAASARAITHMDYTSPGVTTMWIGTLSRAIWTVGHDWGLWATDDDATFLTSPSGLDVAQVMMAVVTAALTGLLVLLLVRWVGRGAAAIAGVIVATEPFLVAHGAVLHTDELLALFGVTALVATALAMGVPHRTAWAGRWWAGAIAGALFAGAWLTKVTALMFIPAVALLGIGQLVRALREPRGSDTRTMALAALRRTSCWWIAAAVVVIVGLYPALWVAPFEELAFVRRSATIAGTGHLQYFFGEVTDTPGPLFYPVALSLRTTPWFLVGGVAAAMAVWVPPETRRFGLALLCMAVPPFLVLSLATKQFDRYGLALLVIAAIAAGVVIAFGAERLAEATTLGRPVAVASFLAVLAVGVYSLVIAPWGLAYFNPALGGAAVAEETVLIGWAEGFERAGGLIARREDGHCDSVTILAPRSPVPPASDVFPCGTRVSRTEDATYVVVYVSVRQRSSPAELVAMTAGRELVGTVEELGITYADVYGPRAE